MSNPSILLLIEVAKARESVSLGTFDQDRISEYLHYLRLGADSIILEYRIESGAKVDVNQKVTDKVNARLKCIGSGDEQIESAFYEAEPNVTKVTLTFGSNTLKH